jgi:hypothetical protein
LAKGTLDFDLGLSDLKRGTDSLTIENVLVKAISEVQNGIV